MEISKLRRFFTADNNVLFALIAHSLYIIFYFMTLQAYGGHITTPVGTTSVAIFPVVFANITVLLIAKRLGWLQGIGVILTSYALAFSIHTSGTGKEVLWTTLADSGQLSLACYLFSNTFKIKFPKIKEREAFAFAAWFCGIFAAIIYVLGSGLQIYPRLLNDVYIFTILFTPLYLLVRVWDNTKKEKDDC